MDQMSIVCSLVLVNESPSASFIGLGVLDKEILSSCLFILVMETFPHSYQERGMGFIVGFLVKRRGDMELGVSHLLFINGILFMIIVRRS